LVKIGYSLLGITSNAGIYRMYVAFLLCPLFIMMHKLISVVKTVIFWVMIPCNLVSGYQPAPFIYPEDADAMVT
jgi:hypothetical protein